MRELHRKMGNRALKMKLIYPTSMFLTPITCRPTLKEHYTCSEGFVVNTDEHLKQISHFKYSQKLKTRKEKNRETILFKTGTLSLENESLVLAKSTEESGQQLGS